MAAFCSLSTASDSAADSAACASFSALAAAPSSSWGEGLPIVESRARVRLVGVGPVLVDLRLKDMHLLRLLREGGDADTVDDPVAALVVLLSMGRIEEGLGETIRAFAAEAVVHLVVACIRFR